MDTGLYQLYIYITGNSHKTLQYYKIQLTQKQGISQHPAPLKILGLTLKVSLYFFVFIY